VVAMGWRRVMGGWVAVAAKVRVAVEGSGGG
jgi:hypothetical protein